MTKLENTIVLVSPCCSVLGVPIGGPSNSNRGVLSGAICGVRGAQLIIARRAAAEHRKYLDQRTLTPPVQHSAGHAGPRRHSGIFASEGFDISCQSNAFHKSLCWVPDALFQLRNKYRYFLGLSIFFVTS